MQCDDNDHYTIILCSNIHPLVSPQLHAKLNFRTFELASLGDTKVSTY